MCCAPRGEWTWASDSCIVTPKPEGLCCVSAGRRTATKTTVSPSLPLGIHSRRITVSPLHSRFSSSSVARWREKKAPDQTPL